MVINEWIFHDIKGENGLDFQQQAETFLQTFIERPGQIIVLKGSKWTAKAWQLWEVRDTRIQVLSKLLYLGVLIDPLKCRYLNPDDVSPLPDDLAAQIPHDDAYLFQTAIAGGASQIVTSDERLVAMVTNAERHGIRLRPRADLIAEYLGS